jgi:hypothetical protein
MWVAREPFQQIYSYPLQHLSLPGLDPGIAGRGRRAQRGGWGLSASLSPCRVPAPMASGERQAAQLGNRASVRDSTRVYRRWSPPRPPRYVPVTLFVPVGGVWPAVPLPN